MDVEYIWLKNELQKKLKNKLNFARFIRMFLSTRKHWYFILPQSGVMYYMIPGLGKWKVKYYYATKLSNCLLVHRNPREP